MLNVPASKHRNGAVGQSTSETAGAPAARAADASPGMPVPEPLNAESARSAKDRRAKSQFMRMPDTVLEHIWGALRKDSNPWESVNDTNMLARTCKSAREFAAPLRPQPGKPLPSFALLSLRCQVATRLIESLNFSRGSVKILENCAPLFGFISPPTRQQLFQVASHFHFRAAADSPESVKAVVNVFEYLPTQQQTAFFDAVMRIGTPHVLAAMAPAVVHLTPEQAAQWEEKYAASASASTEPSKMVDAMLYVSPALAVEIAEAVLTLPHYDAKVDALSEMSGAVRCLPAELRTRLVEACPGIVKSYDRARAVSAAGAAVPHVDQALGRRVVEAALGDFERDYDQSIALSGMGAAVADPSVPEELRTQVIEASLALKEELNCSRAVSGIGVALPSAPQALRERAFKVTLAFKDEQAQAVALSGLGVAVSSVPAQLGIAAAQAILAMKSGWNMATALSGFWSAAADLPEEIRSQLRAAALDLTGQNKFKALSGVALADKTFSPKERDAIVEAVLAEVQDTEAQSQHLLALRPVVKRYGTPADCTRVDQAVQATDTHSQSMADLTAQEQAQRIQTALELPDGFSKGYALAELVHGENLPPLEHHSVVQAILNLQNEHAITQALPELAKTAKKMTVPERSQMVQVVLGMANGNNKANMLCALQPAMAYFSEGEVTQLIGAAVALPFEHQREAALSTIGTAPGLPRKMLEKVVLAGQGMHDPLYKAMVFSAVSDAAVAENLLSAEQITYAVKDALNYREPSGSDRSQAIGLGRMGSAVKHVPGNVRSQIVDAVTSLGASTRTASDKPTALIGMASALADFSQKDAVRVFQAGLDTPDQVQRTRVVAALVTHKQADSPSILATYLSPPEIPL
jgi:hypothetical protein